MKGDGFAWKKKSTRGLPEPANVTALFSVRVRRASAIFVLLKDAACLPAVAAGAKSASRNVLVSGAVSAHGHRNV